MKACDSCGGESAVRPYQQYIPQVELVGESSPGEARVGYYVIGVDLCDTCVEGKPIIKLIGRLKESWQRG